MPAKSPQPPDERFWVKYSRHHELPISGLASLTWHILIGVFIVIVGFIIANGRADDMPIETVVMGPPGGGGDGVGNVAGAGRAPEVEAATDLPPDVPRPNQPLADIPNLSIKPADLLENAADNVEAERELAKFTNRGTESLQKLSKLDEQFRKALIGGSKGQGGPGTGGGKGDGTGRGDGSDTGPNALNVRTKRNLRWTMNFNTESGADYLRQLNVLGAILVFRHPDGELKVVKNLLQRPLKMETDDVQKLNRIYWVDDGRDSVEKLARAMGIDFTPTHIVALFPHKFESELLQKELAFRHRREEDIQETRFLVVVRAGIPQIFVESQRYK